MEPNLVVLYAAAGHARSKTVDVVWRFPARSTKESLMGSMDAGERSPRGFPSPLEGLPVRVLPVMKALCRANVDGRSLARMRRPA